MLQDCFALLGEPRRPWIDPTPLKTRFLQLSSQTHPDRFHDAPEEERTKANDCYMELNAAYQTLREPKDRLLHLLELEVGTRPKDIQRIPPGTMDLFVEIGQACREVDALLVRKGAAASPLVKVQLIQSSREWIQKLGALQAAVNVKRDEFFLGLQKMNPTWESAEGQNPEVRRTTLPLEPLEMSYRGLSYVARWTDQIQQRLSELAA